MLELNFDAYSRVHNFQFERKGFSKMIESCTICSLSEKFENGRSKASLRGIKNEPTHYQN
jgi:hypothetical protein